MSSTENIEGLRHLTEEEKVEYCKESIDRLIDLLSESRERNNNIGKEEK